jgi:hypothetical protein
VTLDALMSPTLPEILGERWDARPKPVEVRYGTRRLSDPRQ